MHGCNKSGLGCALVAQRCEANAAICRPSLEVVIVVQTHVGELQSMLVVMAVIWAGEALFELRVGGAIIAAIRLLQRRESLAALSTLDGASTRGPKSLETNHC
jgi:hypothetical protein